jgi:hypothetical protein
VSAAAPRPAVAWAGVLLPPVAWLADLSISDALVGESCVRGSRALLHGATAAALAGAIAGIAISLATWRGTREDASERGRAERFLGIGGVALGALFVVVILAGELPKLMLGPCAP